MKTAVVKEVKPVGEPRQGQYGMMYTYGVRFENGDSGLYTSTSENQNKFVVGQSAHYTDEAKQSQSGKTWYKIKPANPQYDGNGSSATPTSSGGGVSATSKDELIVRQTALKAAAELGGSPAVVLQHAAMFADWVLGKSAQPKDVFPAQEKVQVTNAVADEGLPF